VSAYFHEPAPGASVHETVVETTVHEPLIGPATAPE
jgi:hypothetical protein